MDWILLNTLRPVFIKGGARCKGGARKDMQPTFRVYIYLNTRMLFYGPTAIVCVSTCLMCIVCVFPLLRLRFGLLGGVYNYSHNLWLEVSHVRPSYRPSPVVAQEGCTYQFRSRILVSPSFSWIS